MNAIRVYKGLKDTGLPTCMRDHWPTGHIVSDRNYDLYEEPYK